GGENAGDLVELFVGPRRAASAYGHMGTSGWGAHSDLRLATGTLSGGLRAKRHYELITRSGFEMTKDVAECCAVRPAFSAPAPAFLLVDACGRTGSGLGCSHRFCEPRTPPTRMFAMSEVAPSTRLPDGDLNPPPPLLERPDRIGRYRIERVLGKGSFGVVYLARDDDLQRAVAIKVPNARLLARPGAIDAYLQEARIVASLRHEHIVRVFDFGRTDDGSCYIVSEYVEGGSLADLLKRRRPTPGEAAALVADVAEALHHAHQQRLVHRDVKPGNILLDAAGKAYLADFGIALRDEDFGTGGG